MKPRNFALILSLIILVYLGSSTHILGKPLSKSQKTQLRKGNAAYEAPRFLEVDDEKDCYMLLYFKQTVNYQGGFKNDYRKNISFIINRENNASLTGEETLIANKGFEIEIHFNASVKNLEKFFSSVFDENMHYLESIDFTNFNSSFVNNMESMFYGCSSLESIDFTNFNTSSATTISYMFYGCSSLKTLNLSNFDTTNVNDMDCLFYGCDSLNILDLSNFNMMNCYSYYNMFPENNNITYLNLYNFKTDKIIYEKFNEKEDIIICQKDNIIKNPKIYNCCMNFDNNECITNYITLTLNENYENDYCWYKDIQDKISYIMNENEKIDNLDTDFTINANNKFRIFFNL